MSAPLVRRRNDKLVAGVCSAIAGRFGTSATVVRLLFIASCLLPGPQFVVYIALWILLPKDW